MDKRWLYVALLVAHCAAASAGLYDDDDIFGFYDKSLEYDDNVSASNSEEQANVFVQPNVDEEYPKPLDLVANVGEDNLDDQDDEDSQRDEKNVNQEQKQISNDESAEKDNPIYDEQDAEENVSNSDNDNDDEVLRAIQRALAEDAGESNEDKLDVDYQVEDNRSQVENEFEESKGEENIPSVNEIMQSNSELLSKQADINNDDSIQDENIPDVSVNEAEGGKGDILREEVQLNDKNQNNKVELDLETKNDETVDNFDANLENIHEKNLDSDESFDNKLENSDEDNLKNVYDDTDGDLQQLIETLDKLSENDSIESIEKQLSIALNIDKADEEEPKYQVPKDNQQDQEFESEEADFDYSGEKRILQMRQDYYDSMKDYDFKTSNEEVDENDKSTEIKTEPKIDLEINNDEIVDVNNENLEESKEIDSERKMIEESFVDELANSDEDTVKKVYEDLKGDLDQLFETFNKLTDSDESMEEQQFEIPALDDLELTDQVVEGNQQNQELSEEQDSDDSFENLPMGNIYDVPLNEDGLKESSEEVESDDELTETDQKLLDEALELNHDEDKQIFVKNEDKNEADPIMKSSIEGLDRSDTVDKTPEAALIEGIANSEEQQEKEQLKQPDENMERLERTDEELQDDHDENEEEILDNGTENHEVLMAPPITTAEKQEKENDLTSAEINSLMAQFAIDHADDLDVNSENFDRDVSPIYITLTVGEPVVIESPNYPGAYPANNIIDWIIDGEGMGIEMNVTDLAVNGILGDYLLVKPGGVDASGSDGLIFSYQLRSERRYRFLDVDRVFVRFQSMPGMSLLGNRGFRLSVKLLNPLSEAQAPLPEPEPVRLPPQHTLQVYLAGVSPRQLSNQSEEFRAIVADMATLYVARRELADEDFNSTDVTQLTQIATCNVNWPGFERCAGVTFGVPLRSDDEELEESGLTIDQLYDMWRTSVDVDPFAARLRRMGVTEFAIPNDRSTLTVWLVIGFGVAISVGMLALALWRWSCFMDYTRMPAFSDTDSVISEKKRNLDLYPTPHQTLPPLYDDDFIKYEDTARVDMGGFANKSYVREGGLFDQDSDDELDISANRDRSSYIQPRDIYPV